jgi:hypothetical protein
MDFGPIFAPEGKGSHYPGLIMGIRVFSQGFEAQGRGMARLPFHLGRIGAWDEVITSGVWMGLCAGGVLTGIAIQKHQRKTPTCTFERMSHSSRDVGVAAFNERNAALDTAIQVATDEEEFLRTSIPNRLFPFRRDLQKERELAGLIVFAQ